MNVWQALILGIVQGVTEFLPISSSGHLMLTERILNINTNGADLFLGIMLHAGTLVAVCIVYWRKLIEYTLKSKKKFFLLILATFPAAVVGYLFGGYVERYFTGINAIAYAFIITAIVLAIAGILQNRRKEEVLLTAKDSIIMGIGQAFAVIPGLSRSGMTFSAGLMSGLDRKTALDFSFVMSIPIILGAVVNELITSFFGASHGIVVSVSWGCLLVGMLTATLFGMLSIKLFTKIIQKSNIKYFSIYLFLLGGILLIFVI